MGVSIYRDADVPFFELKTCDKTGMSYRKHIHEEYSIGLVDCGETIMCYGGTSSHLFPDTMVFFPPDFVHSCNPIDLNRWKYRMIFLDPDWVRACAPARCVNVESPVIRVCRDPASGAAVNRMMEVLIGDASPLEKESSIVSMIEYLFEDGTEFQRAGCVHEGRKAKAVRDYIRDNFLEKITLDQLEDVSDVSKFRISRVFQKKYRIPPHAYQVLLRVNHAKKELLKDRPLAEVALDTGFYDQSHFIKAFRSHVGMTPEKYRETGS